ncbi:MAG TPA: alpha-hydroxy acid oxidase [Xanthobacteraceae bacterium]|nr:alpha-hydroxy acid oxidase [Xanthobacteraceae bacterium]
MDCLDFDALEEKARAKLPAPSFAFCATGADDEITAAENVAAWRRLRLRPHVLRDISKVDTSVSLLGARAPTPLMVAPMGRHKLFHPEGERASARGAAAAGVPYVLATSANVLLEDVAAERGAAVQWFQLYMWPNRGEVEALLDRVAAAGFGALVLTVDNQVYGSSPRQLRAPFEPSPDIRNVNMPGSPMARTAYDPEFKGKVMFPTTWAELEWLVKRTPVPVVVKGVLRGDDAARCVELGAKAVIVSNHGGRHLDTTVPTAEALAEVADAVAGKAEVYVDGGIRRGTDILKALALGARAVLVGRPVLWGLATGGAEGVRAVLDHLHEEFLRTMQLCGVARLADIRRDLVAR